jgi:hypothetical protein
MTVLVETQPAFSFATDILSWLLYLTQKCLNEYEDGTSEMTIDCESMREAP